MKIPLSGHMLIAFRDLWLVWPSRFRSTGNFFLGRTHLIKWERNCKKRAESIQPEGFAVAIVPGNEPTSNCGFIRTLGYEMIMSEMKVPAALTVATTVMFFPLSFLFVSSFVVQLSS
jgi:hypothetical protein